MLELSFDTRTEVMFYLMTLSIHFIYGHLASGRKEGTFYLRLYGVRYSDSARTNLLPPHGILFPISSKGCFICIT